MKRRQYLGLSAKTRLQRGLTLIESIVSLSIGLFLLAGMMLVFVAMRASTTQTLNIGEIQQNGRLAITTLRREIMHSGFWGRFEGQLSNDLIAIPALPAEDCSGGGNSNNDASFPVASDWTFWSLWATKASSADVLNCIDDANIGADVLQIKRAISRTIIVDEEDEDDDPFRATRFYLIASPTTSAIVAGNANSDTYPEIENSDNWAYQHLVYYIADQDFYGANVPTLMRKRLVINAGGAAEIATEPVIDGIENVRYMFGVDSDRDGNINSYIGAENVSRQYWEQGSPFASYILSVRIYVLARALQPDPNYSNDNSYQLGDRTITGGGDHYRRMLFTTTASISNAVNGEWD